MSSPKYEMQVKVGGVKNVEEDLEKMYRRVNGATKRGLRSVQSVTRTKIRGGMRGQPRENHRGAWAKYERPAFKTSGSSKSGRGGGPGMLTGELYNSIRKSKRPRVSERGVSAVVFAGGMAGWQNFYKRRIEGQFPYFAVGVRKAEPLMPAIWEKEWARATKENS